MIYLIGGAPRVGKSIIAKQFAKSINAKFVSTDDLENPDQGPSVIFYSDPKKNILTPSQRIDSIKQEAKQITSKFMDIIDKAVDKPQDTVIEGVHLFPFQVNQAIGKFGKTKIKAIFIGSENIDLVLEGMNKNTGPNNWPKDYNQEVLGQIALFTKAFSHYLSTECKKHKLHYKERSNDFQKDIRDIINELS